MPVSSKLIRFKRPFFAVYKKTSKNVSRVKRVKIVFFSRAKNRPLEQGEENVEISPMTVTKTTVI